MAARLRILFLTLYPGSVASPRYRVLQFIPHLEQSGFECDVASALSETQYAALKRPGVRAARYHAAEIQNRIAQIVSGSRYDIVFVQKAVTSAYLRGMAALLGLYAPALVLDLDDAVHLRPPHPLRGAVRWVEDLRQIEKVLARANLVLAGNDWLREKAAQWSQDAVTFPTVVDTDRYTPPTQKDAPFRVGWIGNPSTFAFVRDLGEVFEPIANEMHLVGAGTAPASWTGAQSEDWSEATEVSTIQSFAVGIMPLRKDDWCLGKCGLKALQYMACGVPCIATPWGAAHDIIEHGRNGLLADSPAEWREAIDRLRDPAERQRLGDAGRATVEKRYSLKTAAPRLADHLRAVVESGTH